MEHIKTETPLLLESIKIENAQIYNLTYHQARCNQSRQQLFGCTDTLDLSSVIHPPPHGLYRCRIRYAHTVQTVEYLPYTPKTINTLKIVSSNLEYELKYADRSALDALLSANPDVDEVLIEKEGYLTDTTIANVAFYDGKRWVTPQKPLLKGTMRTKLIDEGFLHPAPIKKEDLSSFKQVALMNAMIGFNILNHFNIYDK